MDYPDLDQIEPEYEAPPEPIVTPAPEIEQDPVAVENDPIVDPVQIATPFPMNSMDEGEGYVDDTGAIAPAQDPFSVRSVEGPYAAHVAKVLKTYYATTHPDYGHKHAIDVEFTDVVWESDGTATLTMTPPAEARYAESVASALPYPPRTEQTAGYQVAVGDVVIVFFDDAGQAWYMSDDLPFVGVVAQTPADASTKEWNFGGAGNTSIKVTRQLISGSPLTGIPTLANAAVTYSYVYPLTITGQHHGYRIGDKVLCFRRGLYIFCLPSRGTYHGKIVATGPASEADFTDERYWVQLGTANIAYTGDTNVWDWSGADTNLILIEAANLAEIADQTHLLAANTEVIVTLFADTNPALKYPYFCFCCPPTTPVKWGIPHDDPTTALVGTILLVPCSKAGVATGDADVRVFIRDDRSTVQLSTRGWKASVVSPPSIGTILSYVPLSETVTVGEGSVKGVLIGEPPGNWFFPVKVTEGGGTPGGADSDCNFVYTVTDIAGNAMKKNAAGDNATAMSPQMLRLPKTTYIAPAAASYGSAFWDGTNLILWQTLEKPDVTVCP